MTRKEADSLQVTINDYVEFRDSTDGNRRKDSKVLKMQLALLLEPLIPEAKFGGSMDIMALLSPIMSILKMDILSKASCTLAVVDGHGDAHDMDEDEFERLFCIIIPGDIAQAALEIRSSKSMFDAIMKEEEKGL